MVYKYSYQKNSENTAKGVLLDAPISTKQAIEVCARLRNKTVNRAKEFLQAVTLKEKAVKYTRFTDGVGHKKGLGPGKYPIKTAGEILRLINTVEANATIKGLSSDLKIVHLSAQKASTPWHQGRLRRRKTKRTHVELVVQEIAKKVIAKKSDVKQTEQPAKEDVKVTKVKEVAKEVIIESKKEEVKTSTSKSKETQSIKQKPESENKIIQKDDNQNKEAKV